MTVTPEVIAVALGRATPDISSPEFSQWEMWISDALMLISARLVGDDDGQVASLDDLNQESLDYVVREAVVAQIRRPDDATQVEVRIDDGSTSKTYRSGSGRVTIHDWMWDLLSPTGSDRGAFSITPYRSGTCHQPWCNLAFGANYCSCGADIAGFPLYEYGTYP